MHLLLSPSSSNLSIAIFSPAQSPNCLPNFTFKLSISLQCSPTSLSVFSCCTSRDSAPVLEDLYSLASQPSSGSENGDDGGNRDYELKKQFDERVLVVRRPVLELDSDESGLRKREEAEGGTKSSAIDAKLNQVSKSIPTFEPVTRIDSGFLDKPLTINLDLALYKAKVLARNSLYEEAEKILEKCIYYWPEDGRSYVALGKTLSNQRKTAEARAVYERGCQATQGENAYIWQCWAVLESKMGNFRRARELFDASTVADKKHVAAWHGWACLELRQGNIKKARNLLGKGLKYCGGNEYIYQTLALLEVKSNRIEQARYLFNQATMCNPSSCASWLAWAQLEMQQENNYAARTLFEKAVQASPKNRFAWHVWGLFEANMGNIEKGRKLLKIGHALNPRDPVLLQSLALLEYKYSTANIARVLFRRASELDPRHQPVWIAWGWMEWKEGNVAKARKLYQRALSIDTTTESAARCLQAWGVLEQRLGNVSAARRLFRSSININSQSYVTWMTWASLEEDQGNAIRAEEIRDLYFQQRTEVVDDASWVAGLLDVIDPALDSIKRLLKLEQDFQELPRNYNIKASGGAKSSKDEELASHSFPRSEGTFDVDAFILKKLSLDASKLVVQMEQSQASFPRRIKYVRRQSSTEMVEHQIPCVVDTRNRGIMRHKFYKGIRDR